MIIRQVHPSGHVSEGPASWHLEDQLRAGHKFERIEVLVDYGPGPKPPTPEEEAEMRRLMPDYGTW